MPSECTRVRVYNVSVYVRVYVVCLATKTPVLIIQYITRFAVLTGRDCFLWFKRFTDPNEFEMKTDLSSSEFIIV